MARTQGSNASISRPAAFALSFAGLACPAVVLAHHSIGGEFDSSTEITVEGVVEQFELINPHTYVVIAVEAGPGARERERWTLTYGPATKLVRGFGWTPETLRRGDRVVATGRPARKGLGLYLSALMRADGAVLLQGLVE